MVSRLPIFSWPKDLLRPMVLAGLATAALLLPFIGKAYNIDDWVFLTGGKLIVENHLQILADPQGFLDREIGFTGDLYKLFLAPRPPLAFLLAACAYVICGQGFPEVLIHLALVPVGVAAALHMVLLARRFARLPLTAALLVVATPAFLVPATSAMADVGLLALYTGAIAAYVRGVDRGDRWAQALAAVVCTYAWFLSYQALSLIPLLAAYSFLHGKSLKEAAGILALPTVTAIAWGVGGVLTTVDVVHAVRASERLVSFNPSYVWEKTLGNLAALGGLTLFPVLLWSFIRTRALLVLFMVLAGVTLGSSASYASGPGAWQETLLMTLLVPTGAVAALAAMGRGALPGLGAGPRGEAPWILRPLTRFRAAPDEAFLALWFGGIFLSTIVLFPFACVRYFLPGLPPLVLLLLRGLRGLRATRRAQRGLAVGVACAGILAVAIAVADYRFAGGYRSWLERFDPAAFPHPADPRVHFVGEWGFRYYCEERGFRYLLKEDTSPKGGDLILFPENFSIHYSFPEGLAERTVLIQEDHVATGLPLMHHSYGERVGFWAHSFGVLPFRFGSGPVETIRIYRVLW